MTVVSPLTDPSSVDPACGTATSGAPTGGINSTVPLVDGEVLYARNSTADNDEHPLGLSNPYGIRAGDIFVHGVLNGSVTLAAENDVVVVHNLRYHEFSQDSIDLLGLISGNNVTVFRPSGTWLGRDRPPFNHAHTTINEVPANATVWTNARIDAAILALNRSFGVQRYSVTPSLGDLTVNGAIAQKFRGPVATGSFNPSTGELSINSGYEKDYFYDERLRFLSPPYFLTPAEAPWGRRLWAELSRPPFCADGVNPQTADPVCIPPIE